MKTNLIFSKQSVLGFEFGDSGFINPEKYDYRLRDTSKAIDSGSDLYIVNNFDLNPRAHYLHLAKGQKRVQLNSIDIGAYEFSN